MRTIFLVMDSLNRHYLKAYNKDAWTLTPNIDRLAERGVVFDRHYAGSVPCMPARREMMTGRYNFLETPWGPIEPWDVTLPEEMAKEKQVYSHMITDHYHYFHSGGEGYHTLFSSWELERGQEGDVWQPVVDLPGIPETRGKSVGRKAYWANRGQMDREDDLSYATPRCLQRAVEFLDKNHDADNWHLHLEVFDPHEPFDSPEKYRQMYGDDWDGPLYNWPEYAPLSEDDDPRAVQHIRNRYAATLTMADHWLGKFLDTMDRYDMWEDTVLILTTDHGHLLGEHGYWAKNYMEDYPELAHIPLIVCSPDGGGKGGRRKAMTTTIDIMPTIMDLHNVPVPASVQGKSFAECIKKDERGRDEVIWGYFGKDVNYYDGDYLYVCQPDPAIPVHLHTLMPRNFSSFYNGEMLKKAEYGSFLTYTDIPQLRWESPSRRHLDAGDSNPLYRIVDGNAELINDDEQEERMKRKLKKYLEEVDSPQCQYRRLHLK